MASTALLVMDGDADPEVHRVLTDKVYPRQADVLRIAEWTESLAKPAAG